MVLLSLSPDFYLGMEQRRVVPSMVKMAPQKIRIMDGPQKSRQPEVDEDEKGGEDVFEVEPII